jgi:glycosyltransferase involved in cell wall biosynthesis
VRNKNFKTTIVSDFVLLDRLCRETSNYDHKLIGDDLRPWKLFRAARGADVVVLDNSYAHVIGFCFLKMLMPLRRFKLVLVDLNLYQPETFKSRVIALFKMVLLKQVDRFALLFKNTRGYEQYYGIEPARSRYLSFKVNGWEDGLSEYTADPCVGSYVICAGRTLRDHRTFLEAMRLCGLPGILLVPDDGDGTGVVTESSYELPENVKLEIHSDGKQETFITWIKESAIVVIPRFATAISPNGISTYLMAMGASRCVVLTKGPGADDLLVAGEAILVDPEDPRQLANAVSAAWNDCDLRRSVALKGRQHAEKMQGARRYMTDLLQIINELLEERATNSRHL